MTKKDHICSQTFQYQKRNFIKKEADKILKYKDLTIEIRRMWNVKTKVIPVKIGATETTRKLFREYLNNLMESTTSRRYRKQPCWAIHTINCNHRIDGILYTTATLFVPVIYV
jgi:hypothetical protein